MPRVTHSCMHTVEGKRPKAARMPIHLGVSSFLAHLVLLFLSFISWTLSWAVFIFFYLNWCFVLIWCWSLWYCSDSVRTLFWVLYPPVFHLFFSGYRTLFIHECQSVLCLFQKVCWCVIVGVIINNVFSIRSPVGAERRQQNLLTACGLLFLSTVLLRQGTEMKPFLLKWHLKAFYT